MILKRKLEENNKEHLFKCSVTQGNFKTQEDDAGLHKGNAFPLWHKALTTEDSDNVTL